MEFGPAYKQRWRRCHTQATAIALESSDGSANEEDEEQEVVRPLDQSVRPLDQSNRSEVSSLSGSASGTESDHSDTDSDFGFREAVQSSDSDSDHDILEDEPQSFREKIAEWTTKNKCTRSGINELLGVLINEGHALPKDARTLLQTPRNVLVEHKCGGTYSYLGIQSGIQNILVQQTDYVDKHNNIDILVNIDGVPLFKSSGTQFWPILCSFNNFNPFLVAIYYGSAKPDSLTDFLGDFLNEYNQLKDNGLTHEDKTFRVKIIGFVCDTPARAFVKCIKGHTGYFACERCTIKGSWKNNRMTFHSDETYPDRTDEEFAVGSYRGNHQNGISPLLDYGINCVKGFPLDYMHLVCLGIVKRLLWFFKQGPAQYKLSHRQISEISDNLVSFSGKLPSEFARQPRSLRELERWKATELRQFLLYTGPIVLKKVVDKRVYEHFLTLTVAISMLLDSDDHKRTTYLDYAHQLLRYFVNVSKEIYSEQFVVYNVHSLIHLSNDVRHFGCSLNDICAFPYENHLQTIKRLVRNAKNPVAQVIKRMTEFELAGLCKNAVKSSVMCISVKQRNCCFLLVNEDFAFIKEKRDDDKLVCDVIRQRDADNFFTKPCHSKLINIVYVKHSCRRTRRLVEMDELKRKAVCLPYSRGFVLFPLLHDAEKH